MNQMGITVIFQNINRVILLRTQEILINWNNFPKKKCFEKDANVNNIEENHIVFIFYVIIMFISELFKYHDGINIWISFYFYIFSFHFSVCFGDFMHYCHFLNL